MFSEMANDIKVKLQEKCVLDMESVFTLMEGYMRASGKMIRKISKAGSFIKMNLITKEILRME